MKKQTWQGWVRQVERDPETPSRIRKGALAALTGTDVRVLNAFVACLELYAYSDAAGQRRALDAMAAVLPVMQDSTRWVARELIPFVLNWSDRESLWPRIGGVVS